MCWDLKYLFQMVSSAFRNGYNLFSNTGNDLNFKNIKG